MLPTKNKGTYALLLCVDKDSVVANRPIQVGLFSSWRICVCGQCPQSWRATRAAGPPHTPVGCCQSALAYRLAAELRTS